MLDPSITRNLGGGVKWFYASPTRIKMFVNASIMITNLYFNVLNYPYSYSRICSKETLIPLLPTSCHIFRLLETCMNCKTHKTVDIHNHALSLIIDFVITTLLLHLLFGTSLKLRYFVESSIGKPTNASIMYPPVSKKKNWYKKHIKLRSWDISIVNSIANVKNGRRD